MAFLCIVPQYQSVFAAPAAMYIPYQNDERFDYNHSTVINICKTAVMRNELNMQIIKQTASRNISMNQRSEN